MMAGAESLWQQAQSGTKLTVKERRHVISYLLSSAPNETNQKLADVFQVSEAMIRQDKQIIRRNLAEEVKREDIGLVLADILINARNQIRDLERVKAKLEADGQLASRLYKETCVCIFDLENKRIRLTQDLGFYPKNASSIAPNQYMFIATVNKETGKVETLPKEQLNAAQESSGEGRLLTDGFDALDGEGEDEQEVRRVDITDPSSKTVRTD